MNDDTQNEGDKPRSATIVDVAKRANVAIGTVSRYLNGFPIRRANREQIEEAIQALRFRRNATAVAMKTDVTHVVGLLAPSFDEFHGAMLEHLSRALRRDGRALLIYCHGGDTRLMEDGMDYFSTQRIDALVMSGEDHLFDRVDQLIDAGVPLVLYDNDIAGLKADRVFVNNREASMHAVRHLLDIGHRRVGLVSGDLEDSAAHGRYLGYCDALEERGIAVDPRYVESGHWTILGGNDATRRLMSLPQPPTAVFSANYVMALGALRCFKDARVRMPEDVSLISFDDAALFGLYEPGITVVAQPINGVAQSIADVLERRLRSERSMPFSSTNLRCEVILRGSTRPV
ncbi:LacI family DNA-binding transcriptional regulator [Paraburkholderia acidisoli]|uniref:Substrate-binding domain-containing protein n=1 Tax=Paraburkholderia acidisoli TaxID=2571748 RepID=A0A7Z2GJU8_9BURK|nr:LacI family DNA-binding transcriptional regulator [Paraburkholderia acidisoli]QGZ63058.1 substrate-binding domain-containing protein [Paraburkholderia acidisoli]